MLDLPECVHVVDTTAQATPVRSNSLVSKANEGDDLFGSMGFARYEPPFKCNASGEDEQTHQTLGGLAKYDLESLRKYTGRFGDLEEVIVTEKIHGASARYAFRDGRMWCGSRTNWKAESSDCLWWRAMSERCPLVYRGPYDFGLIEEISRQDSRIANHLAEGVVVKPAAERFDPRVGRVAFKLVSDRYLSRKQG
jgi:hypothetical protein